MTFDLDEIAAADRRWADLEMLQKHYEKFEDLLYDVMTELLGFECTDIQEDIARFLAYGPKYKMIQAQRGQAKTTITACYAVWRLIHDPTTRVLILSAGTDMAQEISNWVIQIIMNMPELACMRPDTSHGDRSSVKAFDVHWQLKGPEKSPSVACVGITSNLQGRRADVLIADDIESTKNSQTAVQRERLHHLTKDFVSICSTGDIIYLGTPQNNDSIYNSLPGRGFVVRVWTGRYPTAAELPNYKDFLAPLILKRIEADPSLQTGGGPNGDRGKATDPVLLNEETLTAKELDQGKAYFQLQHMLDTKLMDEDRYPLKSRQLIFMRIPDERAPIVTNWMADQSLRLYPPQGFPLQEEYFQTNNFGEEFGYFTGTHMYVDPAGGGKNGDEIAWAVTRFLAGKIYLVDAGGLPGGFGDDRMNKLTEIAVRYRPHTIHVEKNFGNGAFLHIWQPKLLAAHKCHIEEVWETGQKELRIIDILEPILSGHRLVVDLDLLKKDWDSVQKYPVESRATYSLFFQLARITREKGALMHDDRLDALAGSCRFWVNQLVLDQEKLAAKARNENYARLISNPLGNGRPVPGVKGYSTPNALSKLKRK